jgi:hypothetical protein
MHGLQEGEDEDRVISGQVSPLASSNHSLARYPAMAESNPPFSEPDFCWYDPHRKDDVKIEKDKKVVPCRICQEQFQRVTLTFNYCNTCKRAFCQGIHGSYSVLGGPGICVICRLGVGGWRADTQPAAK